MGEPRNPAAMAIGAEGLPPSPKGEEERVSVTPGIGRVPFDSGGRLQC